jgi:hypothetical protein
MQAATLTVVAAAVWAVWATWASNKYPGRPYVLHANHGQARVLVAAWATWASTKVRSSKSPHKSREQNTKAPQQCGAFLISHLRSDVALRKFSRRTALRKSDTLKNIFDFYAVQNRRTHFANSKLHVAFCFAHY